MVLALARYDGLIACCKCHLALRSWVWGANWEKASMASFPRDSVTRNQPSAWNWVAPLIRSSVLGLLLVIF